ncbi:uncharacterized protein BO80DRAFT_67092 [Aspergillus ibericus CBS 121593]|uniref:Uncharacterized protein n=1 Tax=Aspergillus ibericus CBS 121593 TaxID=1448316 RepID=A0A395H1B5_9EURO|nr:hypothetical protein BO80DRAFT_67092 [Aspergillus ibericus CBS 121593]RAL01380.1 hypothetical protein BO80DRAFT_67092 [Aspergillus ibericus CBS 121593]
MLECSCSHGEAHDQLASIRSKTTVISRHPWIVQEREGIPSQELQECGQSEANVRAWCVSEERAAMKTVRERGAKFRTEGPLDLSISTDIHDQCAVEEVGGGYYLNISDSWSAAEGCWCSTTYVDPEGSIFVRWPLWRRGRFFCRTTLATGPKLSAWHARIRFQSFQCLWHGSIWLSRSLSPIGGEPGKATMI